MDYLSTLYMEGINVNTGLLSFISSINLISSMRTYTIYRASNTIILVAYNSIKHEIMLKL